MSYYKVFNFRQCLYKLSPDKYKSEGYTEEKSCTVVIVHFMCDLTKYKKQSFS